MSETENRVKSAGELVMDAARAAGWRVAIPYIAGRPFKYGDIDQASECIRLASGTYTTLISPAGAKMAIMAEDIYERRGNVWIASLAGQTITDALTIAGLFVPYAWRRHGIGRDAMRWIMAWADTTGVTLSLEATGFTQGPEPKQLSRDRMTDTRLEAWYARLGFRPDRGENLIGLVLRRSPSKQF